MSRYRLEITLDDELLAKLDKLRGHEPRASFVKRVLGERVGNQRSDPGPSSKRFDGPAPNTHRGGGLFEGTPLPKIAPRRQPR